MLAEPTYRLVREFVEAERLDPVELKGKQGRSPPTGSSASSRWRDFVPGWRRPWLVARTSLRSSNGFLTAPLRRGAAGFVSVFGAPGIGKSRLVHEFAAGLDERATVLARRCLPYGDGITFWPPPRWSSRRPRSARAMGPRRLSPSWRRCWRRMDDARTTAEAIAQLTGLMETRSVVGEGFWSAAVREPSEVRPVVAVLDDAQRAEATLLSLIENVVRHTEAFRSSYFQPVAQTLERRPDWGEAAYVEAEARR